jgi:mRNA-degrading endonuclease RelE of RelBE toxin-antitoxin system
MGCELRDEWAGARSLHFGRDRYRLIWQVNTGEAEIIVLRVGCKATPRGTIYQEDRPSC